MGRNRIGLGAVTNEATNGVPVRDQSRSDCAADKAVRAGDKIITTGGIVGVIVSVKEKTLSIRSADAKFEITKSAISEITERSGESSES